MMDLVSPDTSSMVFQYPTGDSGIAAKIDVENKAVKMVKIWHICLFGIEFTFPGANGVNNSVFNVIHGS